MARYAGSLLPRTQINPAQAACALAVFSELGLIDLGSVPANANDVATVHVVDYGGKVELTDSVRYREGLDEIEEFKDFSEWVLKRSVNVLQERIRRPLLP